METALSFGQQNTETVDSLDHTLDWVHAVVEALLISQGVGQFAVTIRDRCPQVDPLT